MHFSPQTCSVQPSAFLIFVVEAQMGTKLVQNEAQNTPKWGPKWSKMTTLDPPGTMTRSLRPFLLHFIAHWGPKRSPKCFQNDSKSKLNFHEDFCFVLGRPSVPKRGHFWDTKSHIFVKSMKNMKICENAPRPSEKHEFEGPRVPKWYIFDIWSV